MNLKKKIVNIFSLILITLASFSLGMYSLYSIYGKEISTVKLYSAIILLIIGFLSNLELNKKEE